MPRTSIVISNDRVTVRGRVSSPVVALAAAVLAVVSSARADRLDLSEGGKLSAGAISFDRGRFTTPGFTVMRDSVKRMVFESIITAGEGSRRFDTDPGTLLGLKTRALARYPDAAGVILLDEGAYRLRADGTRNFRCHFQGLVLKDKTKDWAQVRLYFEDEISKITGVTGRTVKADGRVVPFDPATVKIVKPSEGGVFFDKGTLFTFSLPEVESGDIVEYSYTEEEFNPWDTHIFDPSWVFQSDEPTLVSRLVVAIPADQELVYQASRLPASSAAPALETAAGFTTYTWTLVDIPPLVAEPGMVTRGDAAPKVEASNQKDWEYLYDWYAAFQSPRMEETAEIKKLVADITAGAPGPEERAARLYYWVQQNIRYISIKGAAASGVSGHPAAQTLKNGYGDCTDKAILFATMLRSAGITAYPVYLGTNDETSMLDPGIPGYYGNHCINEVHIGGMKFYLDATGSYSRYPSFWSADQGVYAVNAQTRQVALIPVPSPEENLRCYEYDMDLDSTGTVSVRYRSSYTGDGEASVRAFYQSYGEKEWPRMFANQVKDITPYSELVDYRFDNLYEIDKPFALELRYTLAGYPQRARELLIFKLPEVAGRYVFPEMALEKRTYDIAYPTSEEIRHRVTIRLKGLRTEYLPAPVRFECPYGSYQASYAYRNDTLVFSDDFRRPVRIVPSADYRTYKDFIDRVVAHQKERVLFKIQYTK